MYVYVCVCLPIKRLQIWRQPWLLLFALFIKRRWADGLLVCCAVHTCRHTYTHTRTHMQIHIYTCMLSPVTLALSSIYLFHYTSLGRTMPLGELWGMCVCGCVCQRDRERYKGVWKSSALLNEVTNLFSQDSLWGGHLKSWWLIHTFIYVNHCYSLVSHSVFRKNCL